MNPVPAFPSVADAMAVVQAGLRFVADADATRMSAQAQAECLQMMERANAIVTAARASVLSAFTCGQGYSADADYSPRAWLMHKTRVTKVVAVAHTAWAKRMATHPEVVAALAAGDGKLSESYGRAICQWTDKLPEDCRAAADAILLSAAKAGMDLRDLAGLAAEMYERSRPDLPDEDPGRGFEDRAVHLETTFRGAGVLNGDLTPECVAVVGRCWRRWVPRPAPRTPGRTSSGTTTRCKRRCAVCWPRVCCRSGPGSRSRPWSTSPWPT